MVTIAILSSASDIAETPELLGHIQHGICCKPYSIRLQVLESRETVLEVCPTENNRMWAPFSPNHISGPDTREVATEEGILGI